MTESVCAIVVAYGSPEMTRRCIEALVVTPVTRIVVWDNSPTTELAAFTEDPRIVYARDGRNYGFGGGVNRAVTLAGEPDQILLVNPDCFIESEVVLHLASEAAKPDAGAVVPLMTYPDGSRGISGGRRPTVMKEALASTRLDDLLPQKWRALLLRIWSQKLGGAYAAPNGRSDPLPVDWVSGFCTCVSLDKFRAAGGFDESYFLYFEDVDLCLRLQDQGLVNRIITTAEAIHLESQTTAGRKSNFYWASFGIFLQKHGNWIERRLGSLFAARENR